MEDYMFQGGGGDWYDPSQEMQQPPPQPEQQMYGGPAPTPDNGGGWGDGLSFGDLFNQQQPGGGGGGFDPFQYQNQGGGGSPYMNQADPMGQPSPFSQQQQPAPPQPNFDNAYNRIEQGITGGGGMGVFRPMQPGAFDNPEMIRGAMGAAGAGAGPSGVPNPMQQPQQPPPGEWFDRGGIWGEGTAGPEGAPRFVTNPETMQDWNDRYYYFKRQQEGSYRPGEEMLMRDRAGRPTGIRNDVRMELIAQQAMQNRLPQPGMGAGAMGNPYMAQWAQGMRFNPNTPLARLAAMQPRPAPRPMAPRPVYNNARPNYGGGGGGGGGGGNARPAQTPAQNILPNPAGALLKRTDNTGRTEVGMVNADRTGVMPTGADLGLGGVTDNYKRYYAGDTGERRYANQLPEERSRQAAEAAQRVIGSLFGAISQSASGNSQTR